VPLIHLVSLALIAFGAHLDSQANLQIAPSSMYFSQALVGFAAALFLPSAMAVGLLSALQRGPQYILSFIIVFLSSQILGATIGSGVFRTLISVRTMTNAQWFKEQLITGDPMLNQHMVQIGWTLSHRIADITLLKAQTATQLGTAVSQLATLAAYQDVFHLISLLALFAMVVLVGHCLLIAIRKRLAAMPPVSAQ
jgi:hypothetical protein